MFLKKKCACFQKLRDAKYSKSSHIFYDSVSCYKSPRFIHELRHASKADSTSISVLRKESTVFQRLTLSFLFVSLVSYTPGHNSLSLVAHKPE